MVVDWDILVGVATLVAVLTGLVFGITQVRQQNRKRQDSVTFEILQVAQDPLYGEDLGRIGALADGATADDVRRDPTVLAAASRVAYRNETMGIMAFERLIDLHTLDRMAGGTVRQSWRKLRAFVMEERTHGNSNYSEWFQWLAEQLERNPAPGKAQGAHVFHKGWSRTGR